MAIRKGKGARFDRPGRLAPPGRRVLGAFEFDNNIFQDWLRS